MEFNRILKDLRRELGYTQTQLAYKANLAVSCIAMLETNKREPTAQTLISLSNALNVSTDYLLGLEDDFGIRTAPPSSAAADEPLTAEERQIIEEYRKLPESSKDLFKRMAGIKTTTKK